jgi:hypothetical protein
MRILAFVLIAAALALIVAAWRASAPGRKRARGGAVVALWGRMAGAWLCRIFGHKAHPWTHEGWAVCKCCGTAWELPR